MGIAIHDVTEVNKEEILGLRVATSQTDFIETTRQCLDEAKEYTQFKPVGLYVDKELVGFAMYGRFLDTRGNHRVWLDRFLIDAHYQGRGYGKTMLNALIDKLVQEFSCQEIYLSVFENNQSALHLYKKFGFHFNGEVDVNNEKVMVKNI